MSHVFPMSLSSEMLDRGHGMLFHPCDRMRFPLHRCRFDLARSIFITLIPAGAWTWIEDAEELELPRISEGNAIWEGDLFPAHWVTHPFTGEPL